MGSDEFTVHLISTASMDYFPDNTLASFRNFCKEEIALDGDWRVALSEIIFPSKLNNVTDEEFTYFRASKIVASKFNAGNRNTISRLWRKFFYQIRRVHFYRTTDQSDKNKTQRQNLFRCKSSRNHE